MARRSKDTGGGAGEVGDPSGGARAIEGRLSPVVGNIPGPLLTISGSETGDKTHPDVSADLAALIQGRMCSSGASVRTGAPFL